ncbi:hypothetical protein Tco_0891883 [Tanacetum coccineum]|uniref:Reverse transcriptase domain-containing protein n=1 Tax=Tanacetum coccineum TaxID=301880 RepID=A0ABQ5C7I9_9ASTR
MFVPIIVGKNDLVPISHLFYADDTMFIGLKVNVHKSSLYGLGVHSLDIQSMANSFGCLENNLLFTYLGVKVAANMARINSWNEVIQKVTIKLSKWKAKSLSVGGRLTLLKLVLGSLLTYYMSLFKASDGVLSHLERLHNSFFFGTEMDERKMTWVYWRKVMAQKQYGGLGIMIHKAVASLKSKGVNLLGFCKKVIGNGNNSNFWYDKWLGDICFKVKFNRLFNLDLQKDALVAQKLENPDFAVSFQRRPRCGIEESQFLELSLTFFGCFILFQRSLVLDLPTRINHSNRGLDVPCVLCPNYGNVVESHNHLFFGCLMALDLFFLLGRWWNIDIINLIDPFSWELWFNGLRLNNLKKLALEASIWEALGGNTRNLDSIWEETGQDYNFTRSGYRDARTMPRDGVAIPSNAVKTYKRQCQELCDGSISFFIPFHFESLIMTRSIIKKLKESLEEPERVMHRLRRAASRQQRNDSLAIAGSNLFDDEASTSANSGPKPTPPLKILQEHSSTNSAGFQTPIIFPTERTGSIVDSRYI